MQFDAAVTVTMNRGGKKEVMLGLMCFGQKTLRRLLSDGKSRDCPAVYRATATKQQNLTREGRGVMVASVRQFAKPFFTPTSIFTVIYGEHISHE